MVHVKIPHDATHVLGAELYYNESLPISNFIILTILTHIKI